MIYIFFDYIVLAKIKETIKEETLKKESNKQYYEVIRNSDLYNFDELTYIDFILKKPPNWAIEQNLDNIVDEKNCRIYLYKYNGFVYFETKGSIRIFDNTIDKLDNIKIKIDKKDNYYTTDNIKKILCDFNKLDNIDILDLMDYNEDDKKTINNIIINRKGNFTLKECYIHDLLVQKDQLPICKDEHEGDYNKRVCDENQNYILLDKIYPNPSKLKLEVGDIYDKYNKYLIHVKKAGNLRSLCFQIIAGALYLKNNEKIGDLIIEGESKEFMNKNNIDSNFSYVFGIIKNKKNLYTPLDKILISIACHVLHDHGIKYYIFEIKNIKP